jgi:uncharacterized delta-60 repeat protein
MKKKSTSQIAFFSLRVLISLMIFLAGISLALFAMADSYALTRERTSVPNRMQLPPAASVEQAWVARYNGPANGGDSAVAMAIDDSGNVYVTGGSDSDITPDFITIKYDSTGQQQWVARFSGGDNTAEFANAIAVDASGNVYVTGVGWGYGSDSDYATVKYDSSGQQQWVARYDGPAHSLDTAMAIAVDGSGNVYVTGYSPGSGMGVDYATVKYNSAGQEEWVMRYNGPGNSDDVARAIAVDSLGNVYVTGQSIGSGTGADYATIKYNASGQEEWVVRYNGPGNGTDAPYGITIDNSDNIYVAGASIGTIFPDFDCATIKYNSTGQQQWVARYNGPGNSDDGANAIAIDELGNSYVTGSSHDLNTNYEHYVTIKYNSAGEEQWSARYSGPENGDNLAIAIAVDGPGNVYVTGASSGLGTDWDYATVKYNTSGTEEWVARYNGPGDFVDTAYGIGVDAFGNVYVAGTSVGSGTNTDYATIKYVQGATPTPTPPPCPPRSDLITVLAENFDGVTPPVLPAGWTAANGISGDGIFWQTSNTGLPSPPADSPPNAAWINDPPVVSDKYLDSSTFFIFEAHWAQLAFRHNFNLQSGFDGGVLEISSFYINNGEFTDITDPAVGGSFVTGGYNSTIASGTGSPIAGRQAWSGDSGGFITTIVNLPVLVVDGALRWRMATDKSGSGEGWRIDHVVVTECHFTGTPTPTTTPTPRPIPTPRSRPNPPPRPTPH